MNALYQEPCLAGGPKVIRTVGRYRENVADFVEEKGLQVDQSGQNRPSDFTGGPRVRIPFAPAESHVRTSLRRSLWTGRSRRSAAYSPSFRKTLFNPLGGTLPVAGMGNDPRLRGFERALFSLSTISKNAARTGGKDLETRVTYLDCFVPRTRHPDLNVRFVHLSGSAEHSAGSASARPRRDIDDAVLAVRERSGGRARTAARRPFACPAADRLPDGTVWPIRRVPLADVVYEVSALFFFRSPCSVTRRSYWSPTSCSPTPRRSGTCN